MRIAVYNRWLSIGGGGERHGCAIATTLAARHEVTLLTHKPVTLPWLEERLGLDLHNVRLATLPDSALARLVVEDSAGYDLFVNTSHGDLFAPRARRNALLIFFPQPLAQPAVVGGPLRLGTGFYAPEPAPDGAYRWSDGRGTLSLAPLPAGSRLRLRLRAAQPPGWSVAEVTLRDATGTTLDRRIMPSNTAQTLHVPLPRQLCRDGGELYLESSFFVPAWMGGDDWRALGVQLLQAQILPPGIAWPWHLSATNNVDTLPQAGSPQQALAAYDLLLANSSYTQSWVARRWGRESRVLYPPVAIEQLAPGPKQQTILNVGRFFTGLHAKGQIELTRTFAALCDNGLTGWTLHLVGGVDTSAPEHMAYLQQVRTVAQGYPVEIEVNLDAERLRNLYANSALYWHAAGLGTDHEQEPERCEHFGISIVEAMAAGCVPLAYGCGGPTEIIEPGRCGLLWHDSAELSRLTLELIADPARLAVLAIAAAKRSRSFSKAVFEQALTSTLDLG